MKRIRPLVLALGLAVSGCAFPATGGSTRGANPFLTLAERFGASSLGFDSEASGVGILQDVDVPFRRDMTLTLANRSASELNLLFAAWVLPSSIRTSDQEDALFESGYNRLTQEVRVGTVFVLPPGTFVLDNGGLAGAKFVRILPAAGVEDFPDTGGGPQTPRRGSAGAADDGTPETGLESNEVTETFLTPDVLLVFASPPTSCESTAFAFTQDGFPADDVPLSGVSDIFQSATSGGSRKTLAQVDVYQCDPFRPGLFLRQGGGQRSPNEYFEGQAVVIEFSRVGFVGGNGAFAIVTIE